MAFDWGNAFRGGATGAAGGYSVAGAPGAAVGGAAGALGGGFFGGGEDDEEAKRLLDQIPEELKKYLTPYITGGEHGLGKSTAEYDKLINDPNEIIKRISGGYTQSPGYQWKVSEGQRGITNAAAAGGYAGTGQHQQRAGELAENLANQDYNDYMKNALGLYNTGLSGELDLAHMGQGSATNLAEGLANLLKGKAGASYNQGTTKNQLNSDTISSIIAFLSKNKGGNNQGTNNQGSNNTGSWGS